VRSFYINKRMWKRGKGSHRKEDLAKNTKMCYSYDSLSRVTMRTVKNAETNEVISSESYSYDGAGNITNAPDSCFEYDTNNRLTVFNGSCVSYDLDGNMLSNGGICCTYDSANRLVSAGGHSYTYNAEDVRIRNLCSSEDTTYTYDVNSKLSRLLCKTTNGVTTKYVYGVGLIGEEVGNAFKTYHFDFRGSTIAITNSTGAITDTFAYDTYGKLISRTGTTPIIFGYNGRDGVVTDANGLIYMRARYYSPEMRRFINADIIPGEISNAITLNRFAYANGNPVSNVDPFGLSAERGNNNYYKVPSFEEMQLEIDKILADFEETNKEKDSEHISSYEKQIKDIENIFKVVEGVSNGMEISQEWLRLGLISGLKTAVRPNNIAPGIWSKQVQLELQYVDDVLGSSSKLAKGIKVVPWIGVAADTTVGILENYEKGVDWRRMTTDAFVDVEYGVAKVIITGAVSYKIGVFIGTAVFPGFGTIAGIAGAAVLDYLIDSVFDNGFLADGKSILDLVKDSFEFKPDNVVYDFN